MVDKDATRARERAADQANAVWATLSPTERAALEVIVEGHVPPRPRVTKHREAWRTPDQLREAGVDEETADELVRRKLAVRWGPPMVGRSGAEGLITLTPWGAFVASVEMDERYVIDFETGIELEIPFWAERGKTSTCVVLPDRAREYRMLFTELFADPESAPDPNLFDAPEPRYVLDEWSGEPITLFAGDEVPRDDGHLRGGLGSTRLRDSLFGGVPIERDPRARGCMISGPRPREQA